MGTLDAVQQEQLRAIGTYLSQIRQEQDRSLEDIAAKTYIPLRLLKAIEAGQERPLPEPVFIQGFIRRYADSLGLDGLDLAQKFPVHVTPLPMVPAAASEPIAEREPRRREIRQREPRRRETRPQTETYGSFHSNESSPRSRSRSSVLPYVAAVALVALGGLAIGIVRGISSRSADQTPQASVVLPKQPNPVTAPTQSASQPPKVGESPASSSASSPAKLNPTKNSSLNSLTSSPTASPATNSPVSVKLNLTDRSWVQVTVDGDVKTEAVLPKGTQQSWGGKQSITVVAGNAGAVSLAANGGTAKVMGAPGDVKELTVKPKASP